MQCFHIFNFFYLFGFLETSIRIKMARYRYRRRGWGRRRYKRYWKKYWRRYSRKFVNGSSRSIARIKTSIVQTSTLSAGHGTSPGAVYYTSPFGAGSAGALSHSLLYRTYTKLYEEVKVIGVKISVAVVTPVGDSATPSLQIYTAWDRKHAATDDVPTAAEIMSSSTYNVATALNNNVAKITRSCYASDLMEKATWIDATVNDSYGNLAWLAGGAHCPCFAPSFQMTLVSPSLGEDHNVTVSISYTYYLAFRNPKYGGGSSGAKVDDLGARVVSFPDDDDAMDEGDAAQYLDELQHEVEVEASAPAKKKRAVVVQPLSQQKN